MSLATSASPPDITDWVRTKLWDQVPIDIGDRLITV